VESERDLVFAVRPDAKYLFLQFWIALQKESEDNLALFFHIFHHLRHVIF
jgi:hypothetical protein